MSSCPFYDHKCSHLCALYDDDSDECIIYITFKTLLKEHTPVTIKIDDKALPI